MSALIGIDWGTSNLRAFRFAAAGDVAERRASPRGITTVRDGGFEAVLCDIVGDWIASDTRIVMAGMIGSRGGWVEAPYLPCPADPAALAAALIRVPTALAPCFIVPGLSSGPDQPADVMRGEETQIAGAGVADGLIALPGTHGKWARLEAGRVVAFRTAMTGELFRLLVDHSLLGRLIKADASPDEGDAFARGVRRSVAEPSLAATLFSARAEVLLGRMAPAEITAYLSGLLIGAEVATLAHEGEPVTLVGDPALTGRYHKALTLAGAGPIDLIDGETAAAAGIWQIAKDARP
jgi:2-dehydro-3-deoxygalactonokinase